MGEQLDFATLWERYAADVFRFCLFLCGNAAVAEDLTSETFVRCWTARQRDDIASVKGYLLAIARNLYLHGLRNAHRHQELAVDVADRAPSPERRAAVRDDLRAVLEALAGLPEPDRAALAMRSFDELSYEEIARVLGMSPGAARVKVYRALLKLSEARLRKENRP